MKSEVAIGEHVYQIFLKDKQWIQKNSYKIQRTFKTQYIGELFCRMAFIEPTDDDLRINDLPTKKPKFIVPDVLIHCTSTRSAKLWIDKYWVELLEWCRNAGLKVGLIGASPVIQQVEYNSGNFEDMLLEKYGPIGFNILEDLRGRTNLMELAGACKESKAVVLSMLALSM